MNNADFTAIKASADKWERLCELMKKDNSEISAETFEPEQVAEAIEDYKSEETTAKMTAMEKDLADAMKENEQLKEEIKQLRATPAAESTEPVVATDPTSKVNTMEEFKEYANSHKDDSQAVMDEAVKSGFFENN